MQGSVSAAHWWPGGFTAELCVYKGALQCRVPRGFHQLRSGITESTSPYTSQTPASVSQPRHGAHHPAPSSAHSTATFHSMTDLASSTNPPQRFLCSVAWHLDVQGCMVPPCPGGHTALHQADKSSALQHAGPAAFKSVFTKSWGN